MTADKPLLGMVHLLALPSAARGKCDFEQLLSWALRDAETLAAGGVDGVIVENYGDAPYCRGSAEDPVPPDVAAGLAVVAREVRLRTSLPVGINCLRNDGYAALGAASVAGASLSNTARFRCSDGVTTVAGISRNAFLLIDCRRRVRSCGVTSGY